MYILTPGVFSEPSINATCKSKARSPTANHLLNMGIACPKFTYMEEVKNVQSKTEVSPKGNNKGLTQEWPFRVCACKYDWKAVKGVKDHPMFCSKGLPV
jgi:hypothetical protein